MEVKQTWLTPVFRVWTEIVGNPPSRAGRLAAALGPLRKDGQLPSDVLVALRAYLQGQKRTNFAYMKIEKFVDTWAAWVPRTARYVPPVQKAVRTKDEPTPLTQEQIDLELNRLRTAHPGSPYVAQLERMFARRARA